MGLLGICVGVRVREEMCKALVKLRWATAIAPRYVASGDQRRGFILRSSRLRSLSGGRGGRAACLKMVRLVQVNQERAGHDGWAGRKVAGGD